MNEIQQQQTGHIAGKPASVGKWAYLLPLAAFALLFAVDAYAAGGGGLSKLDSEGKDWSKNIYIFIGTCATLYLLFAGVRIWSNKGSWSDFGEACLKVIVVAAVPTLVNLSVVALRLLRRGYGK